MSLFTPPVAKKKVPTEKVDATYKRLRLQVFLGILLGTLGIICCGITFR
ncbi:hypothetical protein [Lacticaseibacillus saniviri]|nr:hypothetical protein [Lacticaseibacillus saniviri]